MKEKNEIIGKNATFLSVAHNETPDACGGDRPNELRTLENLVGTMEKQSDFIQSWLGDLPPAAGGRWLQ